MFGAAGQRQIGALVSNTKETILPMDLKSFPYPDGSIDRVNIQKGSGAARKLIRIDLSIDAQALL